MHHSDDDEEEGEKAAAATEKDHDAEPSEEKVKAPKLDSELRPLSDEEVAGLDVKVLKAKISVLEGSSSLFSSPAHSQLIFVTDHRAHRQHQPRLVRAQGVRSS